jgi:hypothetical protein
MEIEIKGQKDKSDERIKTFINCQTNVLLPLLCSASIFDNSLASV